MIYDLSVKFGYIRINIAYVESIKRHGRQYMNNLNPLAPKQDEEICRKHKKDICRWSLFDLPKFDKSKMKQTCDWAKWNRKEFVLNTC